jgi:hypothetical protein
MRASFPTAFTGFLLGKSREAGEFEKGDGVSVKYGDAYEIAFESSEGLMQTCRVGFKALQDAADFDIGKAPKMAPITFRGDVNVRDDGATVRPTEVKLAQAAKAAA